MRVWFSYKGKGVDDVSLAVDKFANDEEKLMLLVDDDNIIPYGEPVEHFQSFTEFDKDDTEDVEEEIGPLKSRKPQEENFPYWFFDFEETQTTQ